MGPSGCFPHCVVSLCIYGGHLNLGHQVCWEDKRQQFRTLATGLCIYLSHLRKLENTHCELKAQKSQLAAAEENLKLVTEEIDKYK